LKTHYDISHIEDYLTELGVLNEGAEESKVEQELHICPNCGYKTTDYDNLIKHEIDEHGGYYI